jgi:hypothetical protein
MEGWVSCALHEVALGRGRLGRHDNSVCQRRIAKLHNHLSSVTATYSIRCSWMREEEYLEE